MQKVNFVFVMILCSFWALPSRSEAPDTTVYLPEVSVNARKVADFGQGHFTKTLDSTTLHLLSNQDLGNTLRHHSAMFVRSYGPSGLATNSQRGGAAGQTAIIWNGVNINSPMNGHTDLSLVPSFFFDQVKVQHGGSSALWGSGAMGGVVFLNNSVSTREGLAMRLGINAGNHGEFGQNLTARYTAKNFSSALRFFHLDSENHYLYPNFQEPNVPTQKQLNAGVNQMGIMHETWLRLGRNHQLELQWWWQENKRNLSPPTNFPTFLSQQYDNNLRMRAQYTLNMPGITYYARVARLEDRIDYSDVFSDLLSYRFFSMLGESEIRWVANSSLLITGGANFQSTRAEAVEYQGDKTRNIAALFISTLWTPIADVVRISASARQEIVRGTQIPVAPSLGMSLRVIPDWYMKGNISYSFRLPSLNDLYWNPGGNSTLKPEEGWNYDLRIEHISGSNNKSPIGNVFNRLSLGGYWREIENWIVWLPQGDSWLWMPENRAKVRSYGVEALATGYKALGNTRIEWGIRYEHTIAKNKIATTPDDLSVGKQLMYVPRDRAGIDLILSHLGFYLSYNHNFTGKSFTNTANTQFLPAFNTGNISLQKALSVFNYTIALSLSAENVWNNKFQIIAHRPMPFRIFRAGLSFSFRN